MSNLLLPDGQSGETIVPSTSPSPFRPDGTQFAFDSTTLKLIEACHYKYKLRILDGWVPVRKSVHLTFGGLYATALEHFHKHRAEGWDFIPSLVAVVREALEATWDTTCKECGGKGERKQSVTEDQARQALGIMAERVDWAEESWTCERCEGTGKNRADGKPIEFDHPTKTRENLIRTIIWYLDQFEHDTLRTIALANNKPAVEFSFALPVDNGVVLSGHIDRLVEYASDLYVTDNKTTNSTLTPRYFDQFTPDTQMSLYTFAGKVIYNMPVKGVIIDAAQIAVGFTRFERGFAHRSASQLNEWYDDTMRHIEAIQTATRENHFRKSSPSCNLFGGCEFRSVCSRSPEVRNNFLRGDFVQEKRWNPLETR